MEDEQFSLERKATTRKTESMKHLSSLSRSYCIVCSPGRCLCTMWLFNCKGPNTAAYSNQCCIGLVYLTCNVDECLLRLFIYLFIFYFRSYCTETYISSCLTSKSKGAVNFRYLVEESMQSGEKRTHAFVSYSLGNWLKNLRFCVHNSSVPFVLFEYQT